MMCKKGSALYFIDIENRAYYMTHDQDVSGTKLFIVILISISLIRLISNIYTSIGTNVSNIILFVLFVIIAWLVNRRQEDKRKNSYSFRLIGISEEKEESLINRGYKNILLEWKVYGISFLASILFSFLFFFYSYLGLLYLSVLCFYLVFLAINNDFLLRYRVIKKMKAEKIL